MSLVFQLPSDEKLALNQTYIISQSDPTAFNISEWNTVEHPHPQPHPRLPCSASDSPAPVGRAPPVAAPSRPEGAPDARDPLPHPTHRHRVRTRCPTSAAASPASRGARWRRRATRPRLDGERWTVDVRRSAEECEARAVLHHANTLTSMMYFEQLMILTNYMYIVYIHTYIHTYIHAYIHTYIHTWLKP